MNFISIYKKNHRKSKKRPTGSSKTAYQTVHTIKSRDTSLPVSN